MRILFVINGLGTGGAERSLAEMLPGFVERGMEPTVACLARRAEGVQPELVERGYDIRFLSPAPSVSRAAGIPTWTWELRRLIDWTRPNVVHTTHFESDVSGRLAARGRRVPVVSSLVNTLDDPVRRSDPTVGRLSLGLVRKVDAFTARRYTTHFHAISEAVKRDAVRGMRIPADRVTVVPRGRSRDRLGLPGRDRRMAVRRRVGLGPDDEVVLNVGRQEYQKGQRYLIEAFALLAQDRPRATLVIAGREGLGSGDVRGALDSLPAGVVERVKVLGHRGDVPDLLAAADVFAFPSLYEGLGGAVLEAMALGVPVVASDLPALREVVEPGGNALLVRPADPASLAGAIRAVLDDAGRAAAMGRRGIELFESRFSLEHVTERMSELLSSVAATRSGRGPAALAAEAG